MFCLGIAALLVSFITYRSQSSATERDIQLKQRTLEFQTGADVARLAISVVPSLGCQDDIRRAAVFRVLESFRPASEQTKNLAQVLSDRCPSLSPVARSEILEYQQRAAMRQLEGSFNRALANAREYRANGLDGPAARLFAEARDLLPDTYTRLVDMTELEIAKEAYSNVRFAEASDRFQKAFSRIP
ncbi:MAG TPA: hypothetical protein DEH78_33250 [Solibacterales bacterium]|nr:hypothetical protein [Bryobacterales bacterium]